MKNIVIIGGGTGASTILAGLKKYPLKLSVVVSTADSGGSNARIRKDFNIIPPSDIRQCLLALSDADNYIKDLFSFRFSRGEFSGHTAGNIVLSAFYEINKDIEKALEQTAKILKVQGEVLPVTLRPTTLTAIYANGNKVTGEHLIDEPKIFLKSKIIDLKLQPRLPVNPKAIRAIRFADAIIFGPGDLYTSIVPNLLVGGMREALYKSGAKKILITNIMTKRGESDGFKASDFVKELQKYLGKIKLDLVIVNNQKPSAKWISNYKKEKAEFVEPNIGEIEKLGIRAISAPLISDFVFKRTSGDVLKRSFLRHDSDKLAKILMKLL